MYMNKKDEIAFDWLKRYTVTDPNNYGEWILFSIVYSFTLIITKAVFILINLKLPDFYAISFNLGFTPF